MTASADEAEFERVLQWLADETGLVFRPDQFRHTVGVIRRLMDSFGVSDSAKILSTLQSRREVVAELINQLTVGETYFFREPRHFHFIQSHILPEVQSRRSASHRFRAWSAGCASGEEAYSLAIVCHRRGFASSVDIMATDLSREALDRARRGVFRPWSFRGDAAREVAAYATKEGEQFFLHDDVKRMVRFQELNLASEAYPSPINGTTDVDLIMCRNVLIYFSRQTVAEITKRLFGSLAKGGWLLTASGDPQLSDYADWEIVTNPDGMFYRKPLHSSQSVKPQSIQPRSAQPRSAQPRSAQPRSAQPRSAQPRSAQPRSARSGSQPRSAQPSTRPPTVKPGESADATRSATVQPASPQQPRFGQRERIPATVNSNRVAAPDQSPFPVNGRRGTASDVGAIVSKASDAMEQGQYQRAVELTQPLADEPQACIVHVRALASLDREAAITKCREASEQHALEEELHYLYALMLADAGRTLEALQSVQRAVFLNSSSVMAHFLFGSLQSSKGEWNAASRHYRRVCELCAQLRPEDIVPLSDGETVADIAMAAESRLARLQALHDQ